MIVYRWIETQPADNIELPPAAVFNELLGAKAPHTYTVDLRVADPTAMATLNTQYRSVNEPTDVLSFPLYATISELPDTNAPLGDIVICPDMMDTTHLDGSEIIRHGVLHLLGFDHETDQARWDTARQQLTKTAC